MLDIVVYENNKIFMQKNINAVYLAFKNNDNVDYRIHKFDSYTDELDSLIRDKKEKKIYILDVEIDGLSGLEVASKIREYDWDSIIIITTAYDKYKNDVFYIRLMVLDFVSKYNGYENRLADDIKLAASIIDKQKVFTFRYNHVVYRIPYGQICYIEKEPIIKRCIIHTLNNKYYITRSLECILSHLGENFCRTHQSCIVNLDNIRRVDLSNNTIIFKNGDKTDMLTVKMKKEVKKYVGLCK